MFPTLGDEISANMIGKGMPKTKLTNKQSIAASGSNARQGNGAMLKGKHMDRPNINDNMEDIYEDNGFTTQTEILIGSGGIKETLLSSMVLAIGNNIILC